MTSLSLAGNKITKLPAPDGIIRILIRKTYGESITDVYAICPSRLSSSSSSSFQYSSLSSVTVSVPQLEFLSLACFIPFNKTLN
jgi:hypothetical protein